MTPEVRDRIQASVARVLHVHRLEPFSPTVQAKAITAGIEAAFDGPADVIDLPTVDDGLVDDREFAVRVAALQAAAAGQIAWEHPHVIVERALDFEAYLRGEA